MTLWLVFVSLALASPLLAAPPTGFQNQHVGSFDGTPISILFLPDGRLLVAEKEGTVYLGNPLDLPFDPVPILTITNLATEFERGLLDLTLDPAFESNGYIYLYYSAAAPARFRVSRFTFDLVDATLDPASEFVVWEDHTDHVACCHYGGGIDFGPDGMLYVTMGDETFGFPAEDLGDTAGSVLRIAPDGSIPTDNPFVGVEGARPEIWMRGLRNPFRARWDLETERLFIGEVGGNDQHIAFEELNLATPASAGGHFGWPKCEGPAGNPDFPLCDASIHTDPVFSYPHSGFGAAIVAGEIYRGNLFPAEYDEVFFYGDYTRRYIRYLTFDASGLVVTGDFEFEPSTSFVISITIGPDGALYYAELNGELRRITYVDQVPSVACGVDVAVGPPSHTVEFTCTLGDDQDTLLDFHFDFGDGATLDLPAQPVGSAIVFQHTYATKGLYFAHGEATDSVGNTGVSDPVEIGVGYPPEVSIVGCDDGDLFRARDVITCHVVVSDFDDEVSADDVEWTVRFLHNEHTHPAATGNGSWLTFEIPHHEHDFRDDTGFEVTAELTDPGGLVGEDQVTLLPDKVDVTFATDPPGLTLSLDGLPVQGPFVLDTLIFFEHLVVASDQCFVGTQYRFDSWSDGGTAGHVFAVPDTDTTLTASFVAEGSCLPASGQALHLDPAEGIVTDGAGRVVSWADLSPQGNDVEGLGDGPTFLANGLEFRPTLRFDGVDDALGRDGLSSFPLGNGDRSLFWVVRYDGDGTGGLAYGQPALNQTFGIVVSPGDGKLTIQGWGLANDYKSSSPGEGDPWLIQGVIVDDGVFYHYRDGALIDSGTHTWNTLGDLLRIGVEIDGSPHIAMEVAEILVYDRALERQPPSGVDPPPSELEQVDTYFRQKFFPQPVGLPEAGDDWGAIPPGGTITLDLLANDHDPDGDGHLHGEDVTLFEDPITPGDWSFDPTTGELTYTHDGVAPLPGGSVTFTYQVADHQGLLSNVATVTIHVLDAAFPDLSGRVLHLRADLGVTIDDASGDSLATLWSDLSGRGHEVEASGGPRVRTDGPTGGRYIAFDGVDERFESHGHLDLPSGNDDRTVFVVIRHHDEAFGGLAWGSAGTDCAVDGNRVFGLVTDNQGRLAVQGWCQANDFVSPVVGKGAGWLVHGARLESGVLTQTRNGQPIGEWDHVFDTSEGSLVLGAEIDGSPHAALDLGVALVYDRALDEAELLAVEAWLRATWVGDSQPPVAKDDLVAVAPGESVTVDLATNDTDDGLLDRDSIALGTLQTLGTVGAPNDGLVTYTADANAQPGALDTFTYAIADSAGNVSNEATVRVVIDDPILPASGLVLRLEAEHGLDLVADEVWRWSDLSGRGNELAPPSGVPGPTRVLGSGPRGGDFLAFDGGWLESTALDSLPVSADDRTVFLLARYRGSGFGGLAWGAPGLCSQGEGNRVFGSVIDGQGRLAVQGWCAENDFPSSEVGTGSGWSSQAVEISSGRVSHYRDGLLIDEFLHAFETSSQGRVVLGAEIDGDPAVAMDVAAVLVYDRALSTGERHAVETYLHARYLADDFVNPSPTVVDDSALVVPFGCVAIDVLSNDSDDSGLDPTTVVASPPASNPAASPTRSTVAVDSVSGVVTYCAQAPQLVDTFTYTVADTVGAVSTSAMVTVTLDDPPPVSGGLLVHLETAFGAVISDAFGVVGWLDRTALGHDLIAVGSPEKVNGELAGHPVLRFGASGARLENAGSIATLPSGNVDRTLLVLVRYRGSGFGGVAWGWPVCNRVFGLVVDDRGDLAVQGWCSDFRSTEAGAGAGWMLQTAILESGLLTHTRDGVEIGTAQHVFETQTGGQLVVGAEIDGSPGVDMDVAAVLIYDRALTDSERQTVEGWLASRYGLP